MKLTYKTIFFFCFLFVLTINIHAQQKAGDLKIEKRVFESASGQKVDVEFGRLTVPENRKKRNSRLIELAFVRFKSNNAKPASPIVYLAGGPGSSGIAAARGGRFPMFMALTEVADVIALDQRGVGMSTPNLNCQESFNAPPDKPLDRMEYTRIAQERSRSCYKHWTEQGVDLTGYNTNENADDLEDLRIALDAKKISLLGISYGTHLSIAILKRHEKSIDRVILAGVEGTDHTYKLPGNIQLQLEAIAREVKADMELSKHIPDLLALMKRVLDKLERNPQTVEITDPQTKEKVKVAVGKFDLSYITAAAMGDSPSISQLPAIYYAMDKGDFTALAAQTLALRKRYIGSAMSYMMDCASGGSSARFKQIEDESKNTLLGATIDFPFPDVCTAWNQSDLGEKFRAPVKTSVPTLFISGTLDGRTPVSNAEEVRKGFSNSNHLIIERAAHSDDLLISSPKIAETMVAFLKGEKKLETQITLPPLKWRQIPTPQ